MLRRPPTAGELFIGDSILLELGMRDRVQAAILAYEVGLVHLGEAP